MFGEEVWSMTKRWWLGDESYLTLFTAKCGHTWIGTQTGSYACPVCGLHDGDHHLTGAEDFPVQIDDWGSECWQDLAEKSEEICRERMAEEARDLANRKRHITVVDEGERK
jgi:hypothetical protein